MQGNVSSKHEKRLEPNDTDQRDDAGGRMDFCQIKPKLQTDLDHLQERSATVGSAHPSSNVFYRVSNRNFQHRSTGWSVPRNSV